MNLTGLSRSKADNQFENTDYIFFQKSLDETIFSKAQKGHDNPIHQLNPDFDKNALCACQGKLHSRQVSHFWLLIFLMTPHPPLGFSKKYLPATKKKKLHHYNQVLNSVIALVKLSEL